MAQKAKKIIRAQGASLGVYTALQSLRAREIIRISGTGAHTLQKGEELAGIVDDELQKKIDRTGSWRETLRSISSEL